jgi:DNA-binding MarR family transcriptional regulator
MHHLSAEFPVGDLSLNEYDVLFNLSRQPEQRLRIRELNQHLLITQSSVSRLVDRLASRGLVTKLRDADDARGIIVALTAEGFALFKQVARGHMHSISERVGGALSEAELLTLGELCDKLRTAGIQPAR